MPKETFYNLNEEKKLKIIAVLKKVFREKSIFEANVKEIVETLGIARGSFYQYFENLEDAYFMILDLETKDIHNLFLEILKENEFDFYKSLKLYGLEIADLLFESGDYLIYKNKYLYWTAELENKWKVYKKKESSNSEFNPYLNRWSLQKLSFTI